MPNTTHSYISPNFTHEKLEAPTYVDLVDVFEDRTRHWMLAPATHLLQTEHGAIAATALCFGYFEAIEIYCAGEDSVGRSGEFFRRGFKRVFTVEPAGAHVYEKIVDALYAQARCGFAHDGVFRNRVFFDETRPHPLNVTWPRRDGKFVQDGHLESVIVNPKRFYESIDVHFTRYVTALRAESDANLKANFLAAVDLKWGLKEPDRIIGMTDEEYSPGA